MTINVVIVRLAHGADLPVPFYATSGSAGADVAAAVLEDVVILPGGRALVPTGFGYEIPEGYEMQVRPRSGLAWKHGITVLNTPGTIDSDYRGELKVLLQNLGFDAFIVTRGMRIAQVVVAPVVQAVFRENSDFATSETSRNPAGFGSTGLF